jgi:hypothetical protein
VVQLDALAPQRDVETSIAEPPAFGSKATQPFTELTVIAARRDIAVSLGAMPISAQARRCEGQRRRFENHFVSEPRADPAQNARAPRTMMGANAGRR